MGTKSTGPIKNAEKAGGLRQWFQDLIMGQEPDLCVFFEDFLTAQSYAAADWVITTTEVAGSASEAIAADEASGALVITNGTADNDVDSLQAVEENWRLAAGKQLWMEMNVKVSDADDIDAFVGLAITDTTPRDASDRVGFSILEGSALIQTEYTNATVGAAVISAISAADDTYVKLGFHWDGKNKIKFYVNRSLVREASAAAIAENMAITLNIQNGAVGGDSLTVDYIYVAQER